MPVPTYNNMLCGNNVKDLQGCAVDNKMHKKLNKNKEEK